MTTHDTPEAALAAVLRATSGIPPMYRGPVGAWEPTAAALLAAMPGWTLVPRVATADWTGSTKRAEPDAERLAELDGIDGCIAIVQQSLDTVRGEDDGESQSIRVSIGAREHVIRLLTGYRAALAPTGGQR